MKKLFAIVLCLAMTVSMLSVAAAATSTGNQTTGNQTTGNQTTGNQTTGNQTTGNQTTGNQTTGNQTTGNQTTGNQTTGNQTTGNQTTGNQTTGNQTTGNQTTGNQTTGNQTTGNQTTGGSPVGGGSSFSDTVNNAWYYDALVWAIRENVTNGTSTTTFSPDKVCTRAEMVTFLWRAANEPQATITTHSFTDVDENAYYYNALLWAIEEGITNGTSATTFSPDDDCTRSQMVTFLWRYVDKPQATITTHSFTDVEDGSWYFDALLWAVEAAITNGTSTTTFSPDKACTRAEMVVFLYRCHV